MYVTQLYRHSLRKEGIVFLSKSNFPESFGPPHVRLQFGDFLKLGFL